jgi:circadian clock protein KaiC
MTSPATAKVTIRRLPSGVPGLDEVLGGGLPEFSFTLIVGAPGSGKTTLAHQLMFALAKPHRTALYFTGLGEAPLKMLRYEQQFDFFDNERIDQDVRFINLAEEARSGDLDKVLLRIVSAVEAHHPGLVFIDSLRAIVPAGSAAGMSLQSLLQSLAVLMASWQATTFLVGDREPGSHQANPIFTVADGLIWLHQSAQRNSMVRKLELVKMRGQATLPGLHTYRIGTAGLSVFAPASSLVVDPCRAAGLGLDARAGMGVPGLDEMLGGGLPRGYSLLVAGPSGSGKSLLAAAFLEEGARCGETGVIASFEQQPHRLRHRRVAELIAQGLIGVVDSQAPDLSIDEIVLLLVREIRRLGASRVVIDSLSGFELAVAPTFREDFRESLARLVSALAAIGVTVLMTSELEDRYTDLRFSPSGTAFLTDAIIVQRYVEIDSRLLRVMAVVKVRANAHSDELRLYRIADDGIHLGQQLRHSEGLLSGRAVRTLAGDDPMWPEGDAGA